MSQNTVSSVAIPQSVISAEAVSVALEAAVAHAEKLGVKIISEEEFIAMVGGQEAPAANGTEADSATTANTGGRNNGAPAATEGGDGEPVQQGELF